MIDKNQTIYAQWQLSICNVHFDLNTMNNMNHWAFIYKERFNISYDTASKLNTVVVNGSDGWEVAYIPFNTIVGKEYTISFDYQNPNGYNALSGYQGIGYQVLTSVGNQDNLSASVATKYLATGKTGVTRLSITFKATTATTYFAYNFGMAADGVTTTLKLGNLRISETVSYNTAIGKLPNPTITGYTFNGWYTATSGGTKIEETTKATVESITYYAQCTINTYTISYTLNNGIVSGNPTSYNVETTTMTLKNPTKTGYTFTGWTGSNGTTAQTTVTIPKGSTGNKSYTANWKINNYTITYDNNYYSNSIWNDTASTAKYSAYLATPKSKTNLSDVTVKYGSYIRFIMPTATGGGPYYVPATALTVGKTYTWSVYVRSNTNKTINMGQEQGGLKSVNVTTSWQKITHTYTATNSSNKAFIFYCNSGWTDGQELYIHSLEIMEGTPTHTTASKQYNSELGTLPTRTRDGYIFKGWYTAPIGGTQITNKTIVGARDITYYAHWEEIRLKAGNYVWYIDKNNNTRKCRVLYDEAYNTTNKTNYGIQIVTQAIVKKLLRGNSTGQIVYNNDTYMNTCLNHYNNAVVDLNNVAKEYLNTTYATTARSIGSIPNNPNHEGSGYYTRNESWFAPLNGKLKNADNNHQIDDKQMKAYGLMNIGQEYWYANKFPWTQERSQDGSMSFVQADGTGTGCAILGIDANGTRWSYSQTKGVRAVFTLKPTIKVLKGAGTDASPYTLGFYY